MGVWGKRKPITENWWKVKINRFTDKKSIFNNDFVMKSKGTSAAKW